MVRQHGNHAVRLGLPWTIVSFVAYALIGTSHRFGVAADSPLSKPGPATPTAADLEKLAQQLSDDDFAVRDAATHRLVKAGRAALPVLEKAATSTDAEQRYRACAAVVALTESNDDAAASAATIAYRRIAAAPIHRGRQSTERALAEIDRRFARRLAASGGTMRPEENGGFRLEYIGSKDAGPFFALLEAAPAAATIEVRGDGVTDAAIARWIADKSTIRGLQITWCKLTDAGVAHLARMTQLERLDLEGTQISDAAPAHLTKLSSLKRLSLRYTKVTGAGFDSLAKLPALESIYLDATAVADAGLSRLPEIKSLRSLTIGPDLGWAAAPKGEPITDAGVRALARCTGLRNLSINGCQVASATYGELRTLAALESLTINHSQIGDDAAETLAALPRLESVNFYLTRFGDNGLKQLAKSKSLRKITVRKSSTTPRGEEELRLLRPEWRVNAD